MRSFFAAIRKKENVPLILILLASLLLRFWHLNFQSVWLDELHTLRETDPAIPLSGTMNYLRCCDPHPPLYFMLQRLIFTAVGNTQAAARILSATAGVISVWAIYLLGKEVKDKSLGLTLAAITAVNYFSIYYSQEARNYILVFLFTIFSLLYFVRLIRNLDKKSMWLYALFTVLMLYSHYFGMFIVFAQYVIAFILMLAEREQKKLIIRRFFTGGILIVIGYAPWLPILLSMGKITSIWIPALTEEFYSTYFGNYFGNSNFLMPVLYILLAYFSIRAFMEKKEQWADVRHSPLLLTFAVFLLGIVFTLLVPYIRSILVIPMLFDRYTIVVLPFYLLAVAFGIELIRNGMIRYIVFGVFILLSLVHLFVSQKYYTRVQKTQFRELIDFMSKDGGMRYPLVNGRINWQLQYYMDQHKEAPPILTGKPSDVVDSILKQSSPKYDVTGFWLIDAHSATPIETYIDSATMQRLSTKFVAVKEIKLYDAWARFYLSVDENTGNKLLRPVDFPPEAVANAYNETLVTDWGGVIKSKPFKLIKGDYTVDLDVMGTPAADTFAHLNIYIQDKKIGDFYTGSGFTSTQFPYTLPADADSTVIKIELDNDYSDGKGKDRNAFIRSIHFTRK